ncbi:MAG: TIGR01212 family radical SAM protein [Desulfomonile tiedjei]|uniref:TIGR01212 family radical SAM protein n=1 Tax=Desulfomonile tiedjei TaxID=2358 RepID=A0A9D6V6Y0_9BACT|nr:TIGR01212 family radical SAM protein [Desulfomonile tiedjei]
MTATHYRSLSSWLKEKFGEPVRKITVDAGLGCPNRIDSDGCIYCNPRGSGTGALKQGLSISDQIARGIDFLSRRYGCKKFIAYFQSFTNTYGPPEVLKRLYTEALGRPEVIGLAVGTRPDCVPDAVLDLLAEIARDRLVWVEYGLQSVHGRTLKLINRGHSAEAFFDAVRRSRFRDLLTVAHVILGLPGESVEEMLATASAVAESGVNGIKLHPLYVIKGTALERMFTQGLYKPLSEIEARNITIAALETLPAEMIIHRLTSDPHPEELLAPMWMLDKRGVRARLEQSMRERNLRQGFRAASLEERSKPY